jgi:hypothetical protein
MQQNRIIIAFGNEVSFSLNEVFGAQRPRFIQAFLFWLSPSGYNVSWWHKGLLSFSPYKNLPDCNRL